MMNKHAHIPPVGGYTEEELVSIKEDAEERQHRARGLYPKYHVVRADGRDRVGERHFDCEYFVLDLTHDPLAPAALIAYAGACRRSNPALAADLHRRLMEMPLGVLREIVEEENWADGGPGRQQ